MLTFAKFLTLIILAFTAVILATLNLSPIAQGILATSFLAILFLTPCLLILTDNKNS